MAAPTSPFPDDSRLNGPQEMLERVVLLALVTSFVACIALLVIGALTPHRELLPAAVIAGLLAGAAKRWLRRRGRFEAVVSSLELPAQPALSAFDGEMAHAESSFQRLAELLRELDALERQRGESGFDPWAVQGVRNEIRAVVASDQRLTQLFNGRRHAA